MFNRKRIRRLEDDLYSLKALLKETELLLKDANIDIAHLLTENEELKKKLVKKPRTTKKKSDELTIEIVEE